MLIRPVGPNGLTVRLMSADDPRRNPLARVNPFVLELRERWGKAPTRSKDDDMGFTITPVEPARRTSTQLVEVPDEVAADLDQFWQYMESHPNYTAHVVFDKGDDPSEFAAQARSWAASQKVKNADGDEGPIAFRQLPARNLPDNEMRFSLSAPLTKDQVKARDEEAAKRKAKRDEKAAKDVASA